MEAAGEITLSQAVEAALAGHPRLAAFAFERQAAEGRTLQSSRAPNPELDFELANTGGSYPLLSRSETAVTYSQPLEWEKKAVRVRRSEAESALLGRNQQSTRLNVIADVMRAFVTLQGAQNRLALVREAQVLAASLKGIATERVAAGAISPIEETRAAVALSLAAADVARAGRTVEAARRELSTAIGEANPSFASAAGELPENLAVPDVGDLVPRLAGNPDLARWDLERAVRQAALDVEKSLARPDVTIRGGVKFQREDSQFSFLAGFTVPLAINNRNEGAIREAQAKLSANDLERREADIRLRGQLGVRHAAMAAAAREASTLKGESLAGAQNAYDAVNEGYRLGKFRYLDVLDAARVLLETRVRYVDAIVDLNLARVDVERLVAQDRSK